jgi:GH24 family phage-related lysozyme (muramidase)
MPNQMAAVAELEAALLKVAPGILSRDQPWYKTWSQAGKQGNYAAAVQLIKEFEGCHLDAYADPLHGWTVPTIGYGTTRYANGLKVQRGDKITAAKANELLEQEVERIVNKLAHSVPAWREMSTEQQCALVSFAYNLGSSFYAAKGFETLSKRLREKDWKAVPAALVLYRNRGTKVEAGLLRRRRAEGALWNKGYNTAS